GLRGPDLQPQARAHPQADEAPEGSPGRRSGLHPLSSIPPLPGSRLRPGAPATLAPDATGLDGRRPRSAPFSGPMSASSKKNFGPFERRVVNPGSSSHLSPHPLRPLGKFSRFRRFGIFGEHKRNTFRHTLRVSNFPP